MPTVIKRCISLLLILMLVVSLIPSVYAAETADEVDLAASTETREETTNTEPYVRTEDASAIRQL